MLHDTADAIQPDRSRLGLTGKRQKGVLSILSIREGSFQSGEALMVKSVDDLFSATPDRYIVMTAGRRNAHERLAHETGDQIKFSCDLRADLAIRCQPVAGAQRIVVSKVELELAGRILVVALDHVETHRPAVFDHLQDYGT